MILLGGQIDVGGQVPPGDRLGDFGFLFQAVRHAVEGLAELADLVLALHVEAHCEVAHGDPLGQIDPHGHGPDDGAGDQERNEQSQGDGDDAENNLGRLHLLHRRVDTARQGVDFVDLLRVEFANHILNGQRVAVEALHDGVAGFEPLVDIGAHHPHAGGVEDVEGRFHVLKLLQRGGIVLAAIHLGEPVEPLLETASVLLRFLDDLLVVGYRGVGQVLLHLHDIKHHPVGEQGERQTLVLEVRRRRVDGGQDHIGRGRHGQHHQQDHGKAEPHADTNLQIGKFHVRLLLVIHPHSGELRMLS